MHNARMQIAVPGSRLQSLLVTRIGELEVDAADAKKREVALTAAGHAPHPRLLLESVAYTRRISGLRIVHGLLDGNTMYQVSLEDLASLDLMDVIITR